MWWPRTALSSMYTASVLHLPSFSHEILVEAYGVGVAKIAIALRIVFNKYAISIHNAKTQ